MDLNLRNVPDDLWRHAKGEAGERGITLRMFVMLAINQALPKKKRVKFRFPRLAKQTDKPSQAAKGTPSRKEATEVRSK
jgi:hypothetical protein